MRNEERGLARRKLDREMRYYRMAAKEKNPTQELLRTVRQVLGIPMSEVARKAGMNRSVVFRLEDSEERQTISLKSMQRIADALDCKVVYGLIPCNGGTLEELAERRRWLLDVRG
jgi:transcriptional regulator with XRE-family HTH domain